MTDFKFSLKQYVRDGVTGYHGVILLRAEHADGRLLYGVQADELRDGHVQPVQWFEESRLVGDGRPATTEKKTR